MAGSNLTQVFIAHSDLAGSDTTPATLAKAEVGMYNVRANAFNNTSALTALEKVVFMQGTAGNPIQSPVLDVRNIRRVDYTPYSGSLPCKAVVGGTAPAAGKTVTFRFVIKTAPTDYLSYYPNGYDITLDSSAYEFPLNGFHNNNHKIIPIDVLTTGTLSGDLGRLKTAVIAHPVLNAIMSVSTTSVAGDTFAARHPGVNFDIAFQESEGLSLAYTATVTGFSPGVGNAWQVIADELKCQFKNGNFQRTHIPVLPELYANSTYKYDKLTIEYTHNWPNSTGIAPAGELNQLVIYVADGTSALTAGDMLSAGVVFAIAFATEEDQLYKAL